MKANVFLLALLVSLNVVTSNHEDFKDICKAAKDIIIGMEKGFRFYESNYKDIGVDGLMGLEMLERFVKNIIDKKDPDQCNLREHLIGYYSRLIKINQRASEIIPLQFPDYYHRVDGTIRQLINYDPHYRLIHRSYGLYHNDHEEIHYNGALGDKCFNEVSEANCNVSLECKNLFLRNRRSKGYMATHILIFIMLYRQMSCDSAKYAELSTTDIERRFNDLCLGILQENKDLAATKPPFTFWEIDLFIEQNLLCGGKLGFIDFLREKNLDFIMQSQNPRTGCFEAKTFNERYQHIEHKEKKGDTLMEGGCHSHIFGLAMASYGGFLEYIFSKTTK